MEIDIEPQLQMLAVLLLEGPSITDLRERILQCGEFQSLPGGLKRLQFQIQLDDFFAILRRHWPQWQVDQAPREPSYAVPKSYNSSCDISIHQNLISSRDYDQIKFLPWCKHPQKYQYSIRKSFRFQSLRVSTLLLYYNCNTQMRTSEVKTCGSILNGP